MRRRDWRYAPVVLLGGLIAADGDPAQCRDCYHEGYEIELPPPLLLSAPPAAVLFSGYRNGRCEDDFICTATPDIAWLGDLGTASSYNWWNSCDKREMVVLGGGHAPTPLKPAQGDPTPLQPSLSVPAVLSLMVWVIGEDPTLGSVGEYVTQTRLNDARFELGITQKIFDVLGAGITLDYGIKVLPWVIPDPVKGILDDADCDIAETLMNGVNDGSMAGMQDPARLNVYFVREIQFLKDGLTCYGNKDPDATRYVIFVANQEHTPSTLAHEIGHALGLVMRATMVDDTPGRDEGDVNELALDPYLPVDNLMYSGVGNVGHITVGEVYRMHFDRRSWLWRGRAHGDYPVECQASPIKGGACPPLTLHPTRGWP